MIPPGAFGLYGVNFRVSDRVETRRTVFVEVLPYSCYYVIVTQEPLKLNNSPTYALYWGTYVLPFGKNALQPYVFRKAYVGYLCDSRELRFSVAWLRLRHFFIMEDNAMDFYKDLYYKLFAVMADAVESLEHGEPIAAQKTLITAMREAEETVIAADR